LDNTLVEGASAALDPIVEQLWFFACLPSSLCKVDRRFIKLDTSLIENSEPMELKSCSSKLD